MADIECLQESEHSPESVDWTGLGLANDTCMSALARGLRSNTRVRRLELEGSGATTDDGYAQLERALKTTAVEEVVLGDLEVTCERKASIRKVCLLNTVKRVKSGRPLNEVNWADSNADDEAVTGLAEALKTNTCVRRVILRGNAAVADIGFAALQVALDDCAVEWVDLEYTMASEKRKVGIRRQCRMNTLKRVAQNHVAVSHINWSVDERDATMGANLDDVLKLVEALRGNTHVRKIWLLDNKVTSQVTEAAGEALEALLHSSGGAAVEEVLLHGTLVSVERQMAISKLCETSRR